MYSGLKSKDFKTNVLRDLGKPNYIFIFWGIYLLGVSNVGYFYNFRYLNVLFLPMLLATALILSVKATHFIKHSFYTANRLTKYLIVLTIFVMFYIIKLSFVFPDYSWDGQAYHLPTSVEWSKTGKIGLVYVSLYSSTYPGLSELIQALWFRSTNIFGPPHNLSQLFGLVILGFSVVGIGKTLKWKINSIILCLIFAITIPNVILQSTTAYNDLFFNSLILAGVYFALNFRNSTEMSRVINIYGIGVAAGLVASTKFTGAYFAFALFVLLVCLNLSGALKNAIHVVASIFLGISICFPWYFRNFENFGNPFYPLSIGFGKFTIFEGSLGTPDKAFFDYFSEKVGIQNSPFGVIRSWFWWPINHPVYDTRVGGSGIAWIGLIVISIITLVLLRKKLLSTQIKSQKGELAVCVFAVISVFIVPAGWWPRYVLFFPIIIGTFLISWILSNYPKYQNLIGLLLAVTIFESMFYLSFYAGSSNQSYTYNSSSSLPEKAIRSTWDTLLQIKRENVYSSVSPELSPIAEIPSSKVYISDPGQQYFPLYGLNFQNDVIPAFTRDVEPIYMPSLKQKIIGDFDELIYAMKLDQKPSVFVTRNEQSFSEFMQKNNTCINLTLERSRTYIANCK